MRLVNTISDLVNISLRQMHTTEKAFQIIGVEPTTSTQLIQVLEKKQRTNAQPHTP